MQYQIRLRTCFSRQALILLPQFKMPCCEKPVSAQVKTRHGELDGENGSQNCTSVFTVLDLQNSLEQQGSNISDFSQCRSRSPSPTGRRVSVCSGLSAEEQGPLCNCPSTETQASLCNRHHHRRHSIAVRFEKSTKD